MLSPLSGTLLIRFSCHLGNAWRGLIDYISRVGRPKNTISAACSSQCLLVQSQGRVHCVAGRPSSDSVTVLCHRDWNKTEWNMAPCWNRTPSVVRSLTGFHNFMDFLFVRTQCWLCFRGRFVSLRCMSLWKKKRNVLSFVTWRHVLNMMSHVNQYVCIEHVSSVL